VPRFKTWAETRSTPMRCEHTSAAILSDAEARHATGGVARRGFSGSTRDFTAPFNLPFRLDDQVPIEVGKRRLVPVLGVASASAVGGLGSASGKTSLRGTTRVAAGGFKHGAGWWYKPAVDSARYAESFGRCYIANDLSRPSTKRALARALDELGAA